MDKLKSELWQHSQKYEKTYTNLWAKYDNLKKRVKEADEQEEMIHEYKIQVSTMSKQITKDQRVIKMQKEMLWEKDQEVKDVKQECKTRMKLEKQWGDN